MTAPVVDGAHFPAGAAVVVGGSGGIGREICVRLAEHGSDVALTYRANADAARAAAGDVRTAGREALAARVDLVDEPGVERFFADVAGRFGAVHTVIYAIGADIPMVHATQIEAADWRRTIDGDLTGFYHVVRGRDPAPAHDRRIARGDLERRAGAAPASRHPLHRAQGGDRGARAGHRPRGGALRRARQRRSARRGGGGALPPRRRRAATSSSSRRCATTPRSAGWAPRARPRTRSCSSPRRRRATPRAAASRSTAATRSDQGHAASFGGADEDRAAAGSYRRAMTVAVDVVRLEPADLARAGAAVGAHGSRPATSASS